MAMIAPIKHMSKPVSGLPPVALGWALLLASGVAALGVVVAAMVIAVILENNDNGIDVTSVVVSNTDAVASALSTGGSHLVGVWLLITLANLVIGALNAASLGQSDATTAICTPATRLLFCVLALIALAWQRLASGGRQSVLSPALTDDLSRSAHDHTADHLTSGWRPGVNPPLLYC